MGKKENGSALNLIYLRLEDWLQSFDLSADLGPSTPAGNPSAAYQQHNTLLQATNGQSDVAVLDREPVAEPSAIDPMREALLRNAEDFVNAIKVAALSISNPYFLCFCPPSPETAGRPALVDLLNNMESYIVSNLKQTPHIHIIQEAQFTSAYQVDEFWDVQANKLGHVPYTESFFTSLATHTVRVYSALTRRPFKVIALDCDNTLWDGVCGEVGPTGVHISEPFKALQQFMLQQKEAGMLLCLCSKNVEQDVFAVFEQNPDMLLKPEDIAAWRINWDPKSDNLASLATELNLGLDSFIFLDDNPIECAEVSAATPEVATLELPKEAGEIPAFLDHAWTFDRLNITAEDRKRAEHYRQNIKREQLRQNTGSLNDFLASLELNIRIEHPTSKDYPRLAQLTQRTNQFNSTTIRRTQNEVARLLDENSLEALSVFVSDRFGDYGLVGFVLYAENDEALQVDSLMLSCRALGRGVEQSMMKRLAEIASDRDLAFVDAAFSPTPKNKPVFNFFENADPQDKQLHQNGTVYRYEASVLAVIDPLQAATPSEAAKKSAPVASNASSLPKSHRTDWHKIATRLANVEQIIEDINARSAPRPELQSTYVPAHSGLEAEMVRIWQDVLKIKQIGLDDGFKELGGTSLHLVQINSLIHRRLKKNIPLTKLFTMPTIRAIVQHFDSDTQNAPDNSSAIQQRAARQKEALKKRKDLRKRLK